MITYKDIKTFSPDEIETLFLSVNWASGKYPDKLVIALRNSDTVVSAWDEGKLIGLMNALSDSIMTVYFHYLLIMPDYQSRGIGKALVNRMLDIYKDFSRKVLISYTKEAGFYEQCGFETHEDKAPMFVTDLD